MRVSQLFNTLLFTQQEEEEEQEVRVSQLFNTLLFTQQEEQQEVRVSQLFNTLLFTQQEEGEQEVRVSQLFNTLLFSLRKRSEEIARTRNQTTDCFFNVFHIGGLNFIDKGAQSLRYIYEMQANSEGHEFQLLDMKFRPEVDTAISYYKSEV